MPYSFTTKVDAVDNVMAADVNGLQTAITRTAGRIVVPPVDAGFTWFNQGGSSVTTDANSNVVMTTPTGSAILRGRTRPAPATPYVITAKIMPAGFVTGASYQGLFWSNGTAIVFAGLRSTGAQIAIEKWTNATTFSAAYTAPNQGAIYSQDPVWLRITDDGSNRKVWGSNNGDYWVQVHTVGRTDFLTATLVGYMYRNEGGVNGDLVVGSWEEA